MGFEDRKVSDELVSDKPPSWFRRWQDERRCAWAEQEAAWRDQWGTAPPWWRRWLWHSRVKTQFGPSARDYRKRTLVLQIGVQVLAALAVLYALTLIGGLF